MNFEGLKNPELQEKLKAAKTPTSWSRSPRKRAWRSATSNWNRFPADPSGMK